MNLYEHTIIAKQDVSPSQIKQLIEKFNTLSASLNSSFAISNLLYKSLAIPTDWEPWPGKITENIKNYNLTVVFCVVIK